MYVHLWGMAYWPLNEGSPFNAGLKNLRVIQENKSSEISIPQQIDFKLKCPPLLLFFSWFILSYRSFNRDKEK